LGVEVLLRAIEEGSSRLFCGVVDGVPTTELGTVVEPWWGRDGVLLTLATGGTLVFICP